MTKYFLNPSARLVWTLFAVGTALFVASMVMINGGHDSFATSGILFLLLGMTVLVVALAAFVTRLLNLKYGPPKD
jgi:peptidoglycan/LPS O-acetylase OafA/YrhL